jgi:hypothetical protein
MSVVYCLLRLGLPGRLCRFVIWINPNDIEIIEIAELDGSELSQLTAKYQMKKLLFVAFGTHDNIP